jgi:hypothetical protein
MIIDSVKTTDLSDNPEEAFVVFEERLRQSLEISQTEDRNTYRNEEG